MIDNKMALRLRAEAILSKQKKSKTEDQDIYQMVKELNLYQIELEIQNEDLIKTQLELQASHNKYANLYNLAPVAYFTFNAEGLVVDVNEAGLKLLGMKRSVLINRCFSRYIVSEHQALFSHFRKASLSGDLLQSCELQLVPWSGPAFHAQLECKAIQVDNSDKKQLLICISDISERKLIEQSMHSQQSKMASLDRLRSMNEQVYAIAHSQNHSLTIMDNYIYGCIRRLEAENCNIDELLQTMKKVAQQSRILANIILQMKSFVSKATFRYEHACINTLIKEALSLISYETLDFPVKIHFEPISTFPTVKLDKLHIKQVILNLARNAIEAMRDANVKEPKLLIESHVVDQNRIQITVLDNGPGFDPDHVNKLFEPHFTTKSYAVGLGLSVSRTIVEKHDGDLFAQTNPSGGAYFQLTMPCIAVQSEMRAPKNTPFAVSA